VTAPPPPDPDQAAETPPGGIVLGLAAAGLAVAMAATDWAWSFLQPARETVSGLLDRLVPAVAAQILSRLDLTEIVLQQVDINALVAAADLDVAASRLDLTTLALGLDLDAVLDRIDLNALIAQRVDLNLLVRGLDLNATAARLDADAVVRTVDLDAILARIDLIGLTEQVINAIDLPEIIRESTGSLTSETVRGARMQGIAADDAISRVVDRIRFRRNREAAALPGERP
jgi:hypothetical protein